MKLPMGFDSPEVRDALDAKTLGYMRVVAALACAGYTLAERDGWPLMVVTLDEEEQHDND